MGLKRTDKILALSRPEFHLGTQNYSVSYFNYTGKIIMIQYREFKFPVVLDVAKFETEIYHQLVFHEAQ